SGDVGTAGGPWMNSQSGYRSGFFTYQSVLGLTHSPWMAAKNHQLVGSSSLRFIIAPTPRAYQSRSGLLKSPPCAHAFLRTKVAMVVPLLRWPRQSCVVANLRRHDSEGARR